MQVYEFIAPYFEFDPVSLFLGFVNEDTKQYFWMQREEESLDRAMPDVSDVWIERDDQQWGGTGGIVHVLLYRDSLSIELTSEMAKHMGGYDSIRVVFSVTDVEFDQIRKQLRRVMRGYESIVEYRTDQ